MKLRLLPVEKICPKKRELSVRWRLCVQEGKARFAHLAAEVLADEARQHLFPEGELVLPQEMALDAL
jgi:hypothetical protein